MATLNSQRHLAAWLIHQTDYWADRCWWEDECEVVNVDEIVTGMQRSVDQQSSLSVYQWIK